MPSLHGRRPISPTAFLAAFLLTASLPAGLAACSPARYLPTPRAGATATSPPGADSAHPKLALPRAVTLVETSAPDFRMDEFELPAGCEITDNTDALAAYAQNTLRAYPSSALGLLDLATGRQRIVVAEPVGKERSFDAFTPMLSDRWIVWEEVSPGEANAMRSAEWRLYAAPIDRSQLAIGPPVLVDEGTTDYKLRPHYGVEDTTVYWSVNTLPSRRQEYVATSGSVCALDLESGRRRTLYRAARPLLALKASGSSVVVVEGPSDPAEASDCRAVVVDARSGARLLEQDLGTRQRPAHFADYASGWLAWAPFSNPGADWPDLYLRRPDGSVALAGLDSIDPAFFGRYAAYESVTATRTPGGVLSRLRQIWGVDTSRPGERFRLVQTAGEDGWWQTARAGHTQTTLVLWNDLGPWTDDQTQANTLVRAYRSP